MFNHKYSASILMDGGRMTSNTEFVTAITDACQSFDNDDMDAFNRAMDTMREEMERIIVNYCVDMSEEDDE